MDNQTADTSPSAQSTSQAKRPTWHRIYFLLAAFDVVTVCLALLLSHQLMGIYTNSVAVNAQWVQRGNSYAKLGALAANVNAPGNDIFDTQDVPVESRRLSAARQSFDAQMAVVKKDLQANVDEPLRSTLEKRLSEVDGVMDEMTAEASTIFDFFQKSNPTAAGKRMASMDRIYHRLNQSIERLRVDVKEVQQSLFDGQLASARQLRLGELLLAGMVLLMVAAAVFYGRKIARQTDRHFEERERNFAALEHSQRLLEEAKNKLEDRVLKRTAELQKSELRTRSIIANAHDAYIEIDASSTVLEWNGRAEAMFGWSRTEAIGAAVGALIIPARLREAHLSGVRQFVEVGEGPLLNKLIELPGLHRDGREFPVEMTISAVPSGDAYVFGAFLRDITERKRAEDELNRFFVLSLNMLCIASYEGYFLRLNPAWESTLGYSQEELMDRPFLDFVHPDDRSATRAVAQQLEQGLEVRAFENRYRCKDGTWRWLLWQAAPTADRSLIYAAAHDITEQREAREQLRAQAESLAEAQRIARMGNWEWDVASDTVLWSDQMYRVFGVDSADFHPSQAGILDLVHADDRADVQAHILKSLNEICSVNFEHRTIVRDGSVRHIQARNRVVVDEAGKPVKLVGTAQDVTERSRVQEALRVSEERFRIVSQATNDAIWDRDLLTNEITFSDSFGKTFGYESGSYLPTLQFWSDNIHPDDHDRIMESVQFFIASDAYGWTEEYRFRCSDGFHAHVLDRALVRRDSKGIATRMVGSMMNVTAQKEQEKELREAKTAAESASRAKGEFLANMSHEIRTPMNGVLGTLGILLNSDLTPTQRELAGIARASGESLLSLMNDILDFSKIEAGKLTLESIPFDLLRAAEEVTNMMAALASGKDLDLILRFAPDVPRHVMGDPGRVRQVLTNLLSNAIKFTDEGQVLLEFETESVDPESVSLCVRVSDTGIGIADEQRGHIFEKFTQADASTTRRHGGTGLGLSISSQLVEVMGGAIGVESRVGTGSTFWFTLRLPLQKDVPPPPPPPADLAGVRVLIVDDNEVNRRVLHEQLTGWRMRSGSCESAAEALQALRKAHTEGDPYRLAILDYQMPGTDGEMLGRAIRKDPVLQDVELVMLTSLGYRGDAARLKEIGFSAYLVKPARQSELLGALVRVWSARMHGRESAMVTRHSLMEERAAPRIESLRESFRARVLLAEDHPTNQLVASMMLRNLGCSVDVASNGRQAIEMLSQADYDVLFMDCEMPQMDGFEATAAIRQREEGTRRTPIIAVTAQAMQGDRERCLRAGMDDYISKPVRVESFVAALQKWAPARRSLTGGLAPADTAGTKADSPDLLRALDCTVVRELLALARETDPSLIRQLFGSFQRDGVARMQLLQEAAESDDAEALSTTAHALRGASVSIGALALANLAGRLEATGEGGASPAVAKFVRDIQEEFARVAAEMNSLLDDPGISGASA